MTSSCRHQQISNLLVVAGNVSSAASLVFQVAIVEGESQGTSELARLKVTLLGGSDIDGRDLERARG